MRTIFILLLIFFSTRLSAQKEKDTLLRSCPVYITDTLTSNNFFLEFQPSTLKVDRVKGDLRVVLQQKDQYFTIFFHDNKLKNGRYPIQRGSTAKNNAEAKYSFRSGEQVSYVDVRSGKIDASFDPIKSLWRLQVNGIIANLVERSVTYYKVRADLYFP
jgi:hypothetical protein